MFVIRRSCTLLLRNSNRFCEHFVPAAAVSKPFQISNQSISISSKVSKLNQWQSHGAFVCDRFHCFDGVLP